MIAERLAEAGLPAALVDTFPFHVPVDGANVSASDYWLDLADKWRPQLRR